MLESIALYVIPIRTNCCHCLLSDYFIATDADARSKINDINFTTNYPFINQSVHNI